MQVTIKFTSLDEHVGFFLGGGGEGDRHLHVCMYVCTAAKCAVKKRSAQNVP